MKLKWMILYVFLFSCISILFTTSLFAAPTSSKTSVVKKQKTKTYQHKIKHKVIFRRPIHKCIHYSAHTRKILFPLPRFKLPINKIKNINQPAQPCNFKPVHKLIVPAPIIERPEDRFCIRSHDVNIMTAMTQNEGRAMPNICNPIWPLPLALSAGVNVDGKWGKRNGNFMGTNVQSVSVNDAYINALGVANFWMRGFASVSFGNPTVRSNPANYGRLGAAEYSAAYANNVAGNNRTQLQLEQAYVTIGDFTRFPIFFQAGKAFQDYGRYWIHPMTRTMTQVMSETLAPSAKIGWIYNGFHGSIYTFENRIIRFTHSPSNRANYGLALGFDQPACAGFCYRWRIGGAYLYNLMGVNDIAYNVVNFTRTDHYERRVSGTSIYGDIYNGPFTLHARYSVAIRRFSVIDLPRNGAADYVNKDINEFILLFGSNGAKPWAADFLATYHYTALWGCRPQTLYLGYQASRQAAGLNLPRARFLAGYNIEILPVANIGVEWEHDLAYTVSSGGLGRNGDLVTLRAAVKLS